MSTDNEIRDYTVIYNGKEVSFYADEKIERTHEGCGYIIFLMAREEVAIFRITAETQFCYSVI